MASELPRREFRKADFLFDGFPYDSAWVASALDRRDSRMFVDNPSSPAVALLCYRDGVSFIAGEPDPSAARSLIHTATELSDDPPRLSWISLPSDPWTDIFRSEFGYTFYVFKRVSFTFDPSKAPRLRQWERAAPDGLVLQRIDLALARRIASELDPSFGLCWPSPEEFVEKSLGFCLTKGDSIVSIAWSAFQPGTRMLPAVSTAPPFRGRGFAPLTCAPLIRHCLENNIEPEWSAALVNHASLSVARKLGFSRELIHHWAQYCPFNLARRAVSIDPETLDGYVGDYEAAQRRFVIGRKGPTLFFYEQLPGGRLPEQELAPEAPDRFFMRAADVQLTFNRDQNGRVNAFILRAAGKDHLIRRST